MAFELDLDTKSSIKVVCSKDKSLKMTEEEFTAYLESGADETLLKFSEGSSIETCTLFELRLTLSYKAHQNVLDDQMTTDNKGRHKPSMKYVLEELRSSLVDIINPKDTKKPLEFKRENDQMASRELIAKLYSAGVAIELISARNHSIEGKDESDSEQTKKKLKR